MNLYYPEKINPESLWAKKEFKVSQPKNRIRIDFNTVMNKEMFPFLNDYPAEKFHSMVFTHDLTNDFNRKGYLKKNDFPEMINQKTFHKAYKYLNFHLFYHLLALQK